MLRLGLVAGLALGTTACSAPQREALLGVDPRQVRLDRDRAVPPRPAPSDREARRRSVRAGALAAVRAYRGAADAVPPLLGRHGGRVAVADAVAVHEAHLTLLGPGPAAPSPLLGGVVADEGGRQLAPAARPAAVVGAGTVVALAAAAAERASDDADADLALLHARVAAARAAQDAALAGAGATGPTWPTDAAPTDVVEALQGLLAQEHRARWSYGVVLAWSTDRAEDASRARLDHARRVDALTSLLRRLGTVPVGALAAYPTDTDGRPVDGPQTAGDLALRLEGAVATATALVLRSALAPGPTADGGPDPWLADPWVAASVPALAEAERARWSWGGAPVPLPGG